MDPILGMDPILEILAMEPTTTTKIMVTIIYVARLEMLKKSGPAAGAKNIINGPTVWSGILNRLTLNKHNPCNFQKTES